jgi:multicomponent Na+:H+ antiporter subunit D
VVELLAHPVVPFLVGAGLVAALPRRVGAAVAVAVPGLSLVLLLRVDRDEPLTAGLHGYELTLLRLDGLAAPFAYAFVVISALAALYGATTMARAERAAALVHAGCGLGVVLAGDLLTLFVLWEVKAVASTVLIAVPGRPGASGAAMRYLYLHIIGGTLLLAGVLWHLSAGGSLAFDALGGHPSSNLVLLAFLLSAAMPPLHAWLPDAYPAASVAGTVFLSAFTTKSAVYALLRGFAGTELLIVAGVGMALYGVVYAVLENDVRRLLGYHIVSQVGFMVAGAGVGTAAAINGATAHAFAHILYKGLLLMAVGAVVHATGRSKLTDLGGLARAMPVLLVLYMVGALSISGAPLFSGFVSKELVTDAAGAGGYDAALWLLKLASVGTFLSVGLKLPLFGWGGPARDLPRRPVPSTMIVAMATVAIMNIAIGVQPAVLYDLLPFPVAYEPFAAHKVVEVLQLLTFTGLAFWLLAVRLRGEPSITLDTDWVYRARSQQVRVAAADVGGRLASAREAARTRAATAVRSRLAIDRDLDRVPPVTSMNALGVVTLATFLVVLAVGLLA